MRLGDWVLMVSMVLNILAAIAYAYQGYWSFVGYWLAAFQLNFWLIWMR